MKFKAWKMINFFVILHVHVFLLYIRSDPETHLFGEHFIFIKQTKISHYCTGLQMAVLQET